MTYGKGDTLWDVDDDDEEGEEEEEDDDEKADVCSIPQWYWISNKDCFSACNNTNGQLCAKPNNGLASGSFITPKSFKTVCCDIIRDIVEASGAVESDEDDDEDDEDEE